MLDESKQNSSGKTKEELLLEEEELKKVTKGQLNIIGDTHGQYEDVLKIFSGGIGGFPSSLNKFVFNGDMVDRGPRGSEILVLLLSFKLLNPDSVHLLRGNHETDEMISNYGFAKEAKNKYGMNTLT